MKTSNFQKLFLAIVAVGLALSTMTVAAQNSPVSAAPPLSYGVPQVLQLAQAKVSDDTIIAYIHNSGNSYGLDANQIIYLRQQGISDNAINFMLNQPKAASAPAQPAAQPENSYARRRIRPPTHNRTADLCPKRSTLDRLCDSQHAGLLLQQLLCPALVLSVLCESIPLRVIFLWIWWWVPRRRFSRRWISWRRFSRRRLASLIKSHSSTDPRC